MAHDTVNPSPTPKTDNPQAEASVGPLDDFLNPKSMLTPGVAGSLVMLLTNAICYNFVELPHRWVGLILSGTLGILIFGKGKMPLSQRLTFYVLNSLIIFSVGMGTANFIAQPSPQSGGGSSTLSSGLSTDRDSSVFDLFASSAYAQENLPPLTNLPGSVTGQSNAFEQDTMSSTNLIATNAPNEKATTNTVQQSQTYYREELTKLSATNELLQLRIRNLESQKPKPNSAPRSFFQQW